MGALWQRKERRPPLGKETCTSDSSLGYSQSLIICLQNHIPLVPHMLLRASISFLCLHCTRVSSVQISQRAGFSIHFFSNGLGSNVPDAELKDPI